MEFYAMINEFIFILRFHVSNLSNNQFGRYLGWN